MLKKRNFWIGILVGFIIGFLYGWLGIWATYTALEKQNRTREAELEDVKKAIYYIENIHRQREEIVEWNIQANLPVPEWAETEEGNQ